MVPPNKILIIRMSSIGDIVLASPLIRVLRKRFPSSQIDFIVRREYADLVRYNPNLSGIHEFETGNGLRELQRMKNYVQREKYDLILDIHNSLRSRYLHRLGGAKKIAVLNKRVFARTVLVKLKKNIYRNIVSVADRYIEPVKSYGIENDDQGLELFISDDTTDKISTMVSSFKTNEDGKVIGFCPSAKHATKRWPEERFIETGIRLVQDLKVKIILFGGNDDAVLCRTIKEKINAQSEGEWAVNYSGQLSLLETAAAMKFCDVIVTNDSGLMHIAAAMKRKIVAIFGSTVREFGFAPVGTENIVLEQKGLYCRPCSHIGLNRCPERHFRCMNEIQVDTVVDSIKACISNK